MIRRLLRYLALVPFRKVAVYLINGELVRGRVRSVLWGSIDIELAYKVTRASDTFVGWLSTEWGAVVRSRADEGRSWCRGWSGPAVNALKTTLALHGVEPIERSYSL